MNKNQAKNKILLFSTAYFPLVGGAEIAVREITQRLPNWQFDMITAKIQRNLSKSETIGNINVHRIGFGFNFDKFLLPILGLLKARELEKENNYDLTWSIMASQAGVTASFFKILNPSKKMLLTLQEGDLEEHLKRYIFGIDFLYKIFIKPWHLISFKKADYLTAISQDLKERALENKIRVPVKIVPNGVDIEKFKRSNEEERQELKQVLKIKPNEKVIITASRLVYKNAVDDLIKAGQYLKFPFKILIAGSGKEEKKLRELTRNLKLSDRVLFLGQIDYDQLPKYYSIADVFVRPSRSEGFGNVFLEAIACGIPFIATSVGGIKDFLRNGEIGLACNVNDPQNLAKKIKQAINNDMDQIVKNGQELVRQKYSWSIIAKQMEEVFFEIV